ncbi:PLP-dependent cysteine synthase family protein [Lentzea nigeriaca]|uniref:PLP-dependent cysteine synthase family protein n=1 Tax=Lentzea nigeriaca TaxID=1128665 RepID=UPI00195E82E8|nr:cysteine synthase family protein [Lentzea nigeriaca]MBM7856330.1 cysteine synthase A [Lentzea nigeriaca]
MTITPHARPLVVETVEDLVGNTPLMRLSLPGTRPDITVLAKLEMFNPLSSVKDRAALHMLRHAERTGLLPPTGGTVVEASSGNTGISLAALCAARGHRCIIVLPDNATNERQDLLRAFGAEIVFSPFQDGLVAAIAKAQEVHRSLPGSWLAAQDKNPVNVQAHYETTGPEIWRDTGHDVDVLVCAVGTGGTLTGVAHFLKERTDVHVVAVEPAGSPVMSGGERGTHRIPGIGGGFINDVTDMSCIDEILTVTDLAAHATTRELAARGLFVGISSGAAVAGTRVIASRDRWAGATVVTILPDSGERYLSIWDSLETEQP